MGTTFDAWDDPYLAHYGVIGMRWGFRKDPKEAFRKAMDKKNRLDRRSTEKRLEATKASVKYQNSIVSLGKTNKQKKKTEDRQKNPRKASEKNEKKIQKLSAKATKQTEQKNKLLQKSEKANYRATKAEYKAAKWTNNVLKVFGTMNYSEIEHKYGISA